MRNTPLVTLLSAGLALLSVPGAFSAAPNPTPTRESILVAGFETDAATRVTSDPLGTGENLATINTDATFVAEGSRSVKVDMNGVADWSEAPFVLDFQPALDIKGHLVLSLDVYAPAESLNNGDTADSWFQFYPRVTTTDPADDTKTVTTELGMRQLKLEAGWNHLVWNLKTGTDTKIVQFAFGATTNPDKPYTGPIYLDNLRVYKGSFVGLQPDEKLIAGFDDAADKGRFVADEGVAVDVNTDAAFILAGAGSLKIDLTNLPGGASNSLIRAEDLGAAIDVANATALHLDVFLPQASLPTGDWRELGFGVVGTGGEVQGLTGGIGGVTDQWVTLEIPLTAEQAKTLSAVKGLYLRRNDDPGSEWNGPIYIDNLRAVVPDPSQPAAGG
jgi:hypothetical protein